MAQTIVVTGGHMGIGGATTRHLLDGGAHVVVASRDHARARRELGALADRVELLALDLASLDSVRACAAALAAGGRPPLRGLICNAGIQIVGPPERSADGWELTYAVNHLGHVLLVLSLLPHLARPARVVMLGSATHDPAQFTGIAKAKYRGARALAEPDAEAYASEGPLKAGHRAYSTSKLCNILFAYGLAERLQAAGEAVTVNAYDPGLVPATGLARRYGAASRFVFARVVPPLLPLLRPFFFAQTMDEAGRWLARLALDPQLDGVSGRYFSGSREARSSAQSYDAALQRELLEGSAALVGAPLP